VDGRLTVKARNARLIDVLYSACDLIGAQLNAPEDADQLILRAVGPARPQDVLASLLRGSPFNYSISGSADDPNAVVSVTVFPKDKPKDKKGGNDKEADSPSPAQQLQDLMALAQAELADSGTNNATEGTGSETGNADSGSADTSSPRAQAFLRVLEADPNLIAKLEARINDSGTAADVGAAGTDTNSADQPPAPAPATPSLGRRGRHR
jgi:hypothetical protein